MNPIVIALYRYANQTDRPPPSPTDQQQMPAYTEQSSPVAELYSDAETTTPDYFFRIA